MRSAKRSVLKCGPVFVSVDGGEFVRRWARMSADMKFCLFDFDGEYQYFTAKKETDLGNDGLPDYSDSVCLIHSEGRSMVEMEVANAYFDWVFGDEDVNYIVSVKVYAEEWIDTYLWSVAMKASANRRAPLRFEKPSTDDDDFIERRLLTNKLAYVADMLINGELPSRLATKALSLLLRQPAHYPEIVAERAALFLLAGADPTAVVTGHQAAVSFVDGQGVEYDIIRRVIAGAAAFSPWVDDYDLLVEACSSGDVSATVALVAGVTAAVSVRALVPLLETACKNGHVAVVTALLAAGAEPSGADGHWVCSRKPLDVAAEGGHRDVATLLLAANAQLDQRVSAVDRSALEKACEAGSVDVFCLLLPLASDGLKERCLETAAKKGKLPFVKLLLPYFENVELPAGDAGDAGDNDLRGAALRAAASGGKLDCVEFLLDAGTSIDAVDGKGFTSLSRATAYHHADAMRVLLRRGADVHQRSSEGFEPLHIAAGSGNLPAAVAFVQAGADINARDNAGVTPLMKAAAGNGWRGQDKGCSGTILFLLASGADVNAFDARGVSALFRACISNSRAMAVELLIAAGANVQAEEQGNRVSPLFPASELSSPDTVLCLIRAGATVNTTVDAPWSTKPRPYQHFYDYNPGDTPLHVACRKAGDEVVAALLRNGADHSAIDSKGETPLSIAVKSGDPSGTRCVDELLRAGANIEGNIGNGLTALQFVTGRQASDLLDASEVKIFEKTSLALIVTLTINGAFVDREDDASNSPLCNAVRNRKSIAACVALICGGADVEWVHRGTGLALLAVSVLRHRRVQLVELLLAAGANPDCRYGSRNGTALHLANTGEMVAALAAGGARLDARDQHGFTPLCAAATRGDESIVAALLAVGADPYVRHKAKGGVVTHAASSHAVLKALASAGVDLDFADFDGYTGFESAVFDSPALALAFIRCGVVPMSELECDLDQDGEREAHRLLHDLGCTPEDERDEYSVGRFLSADWNA